MPIELIGLDLKDSENFWKSQKSRAKKKRDRWHSWSDTHNTSKADVYFNVTSGLPGSEEVVAFINDFINAND